MTRRMELAGIAVCTIAEYTSFSCPTAVSRLNEICQAFGMTHIQGVAQAVKSLERAADNDKKLSKSKVKPY